MALEHVSAPTVQTTNINEYVHTDAENRLD